MPTTSRTANVSEAVNTNDLLQQRSTTTQPSVLTQEDLMKFSIGLRILGEERKQRFLTFLATLTAESQEKREGSTHGI